MKKLLLIPILGFATTIPIVAVSCSSEGIKKINSDNELKIFAYDYLKVNKDDVKKAFNDSFVEAERSKYSFQNNAKNIEVIMSKIDTKPEEKIEGYTKYNISEIKIKLSYKEDNKEPIEKEFSYKISKDKKIEIWKKDSIKKQ